MLSPLTTLQRLQPLLGLFLLTGALSLAGVLTRPIASLALFWPVNAILLGLLLRRPHLATPAGWAALYFGMVAVDLGTGNDWGSALWLNACNLGLIATGWRLLGPLPQALLTLKRPQGLLSLFGACLAGAAVAASMACLTTTGWFDDTAWTTWLAWFSEQFSTGLLLLPAVLSAPRRPSLAGLRLAPADAWPLLGLALALLAVLLVGGPGAIAFPMLALLWCALRFRPFTVALLGLLSGAVEIVMVAENLTHFGPLHNSAGVDTLASARLGIAVLTLGPLSVAAVGAFDRRLLRRLARRANHDSLTGALVRRALSQGVEKLLERRRHCGDLPISLLMIDLDHFKTINDRHGHAAGDQVLRLLARLLSNLLRREDLFGRLGGEEFVMVLPGVRTDEAMLVAERLRQGVERMEWPEGIRVTVSVGVGSLDDGTAGQPLEQRLARVDEALYQAKAQGRNRVVRAA